MLRYLLRRLAYGFTILLGVNLLTFVLFFQVNTPDDKITSLTRAMVEVVERLSWPSAMVVQKHCVGGLPGNRTTPIVVAIVASLGLIMPKTSSRAITLPSGTADTMETLAPVDLDIGAMRRVVEAEGGCIAWGGAVRLSPANDVLIRIERALDIDNEGQLIAWSCPKRSPRAPVTSCSICLWGSQRRSARRRRRAI